MIFPAPQQQQAPQGGLQRVQPQAPPQMQPVQQMMPMQPQPQMAIPMGAQMPQQQPQPQMAIPMGQQMPQQQLQQPQPMPMPPPQQIPQAPPQPQMAVPMGQSQMMQQQPQQFVGGPTSNGPRVLMCLPTYQDADWRFHLAFDSVKRFCEQNGIYYAVSPNWMYGVAETRERFIDIFLGTDMTHLFFLDSDCVAPAESVVHLLQDQKEVVSGVYWNSLFTGLAAWVGNQPINPEQPSQLVQVERIGMGCTLIQRNLLDAIRNNNFRPAFYYNTSNNVIHSEDFYFCELIAQKFGIRPWCDMRVQVGHLKTLVVRPNGSIGL